MLLGEKSQNYVLQNWDGEYKRLKDTAVQKDILKVEDNAAKSIKRPH